MDGWRRSVQKKVIVWVRGDQAKENATRRITLNSNCDVPWYANSDKGRTKNGCNWRAVKASGRWGNVTREAQGGCRVRSKKNDSVVRLYFKKKINRTKIYEWRLIHVINYFNLISFMFDILFELLSKWPKY